MHGTAKKPSGGLTKSHHKYKYVKIISKKISTSKKIIKTGHVTNHIVKLWYFNRKNEFTDNTMGGNNKEDILAHLVNLKIKYFSIISRIKIPLKIW